MVHYYQFLYISVLFVIIRKLYILEYSPNLLLYKTVPEMGTKMVTHSSEKAKERGILS
jgi:hypothetical protein